MVVTLSLPPHQPRKMESFDIPLSNTVKQEPNLLPASKYGTGFVLPVESGGVSSYTSPPFPQYETSIYVLPIEELSNNPYKTQQDGGDEKSREWLFQKYPTTSSSSSDHNWLPPSMTGEDCTNALPQVPSSSPPFPFGKEKAIEKDEDFLAQLLDVGGFLDGFGSDLLYNSFNPSNELSIPVQPVTGGIAPLPNHPSPPQHSPMQLIPSYHQYDLTQPLEPNTNEYNGLENPGFSPPIMGEEHDPLVSGFNEVMPSPSNEVVPLSNSPNQAIAPPPDDDLQDLLGELFGKDHFSLSNSLVAPHADTNVIPVGGESINNTIIPSSIPLSLSPTSDIETNQQSTVNETMIPSLDIPPVPKKHRGSSDSSSSTLASFLMDERPMEIQLEEEPKKKPFHSSPLNSPPQALSPKEVPVAPPTRKGHTASSGSGAAAMFGQNEEEIIQKLMSSHNRKGGAAKPITRDKLVIMPVEDFNSLLDEALLTEIEVAFMKEWRRRGKNKMAAQIARKRKREELFELEDDMDSLRHKKAKLQQSVAKLNALIASYKRKVELGEKRIYERYSQAHGSLVSNETHTIHITDDGKTMLIPRTSDQVLLV